MHLCRSGRLHMKKLGIALLSLMVLSGCAEQAPTFSILPESDVFYQSPSKINNKLDILWVIDNSGSMAEEQQNLASNFSSFINSFVTKGYDFKIAVTTTDAWKASYVNQPALAKFKDGTNQTSHTGVFVITPSTPNLINTFVTNVNQGTAGDGDERAFQSFKASLNSSLNSGFLRTDSFLAVIIVSDEDDFSTDSATSLNHNYNSSALHTVSSYTSYLDTLTQSTSVYRRYSVSAIAIKDTACAQANQASGGIMGQRYITLAAQTDGVVGDICAPSYASTLNEIQNRIAELSTQFYLSRVPVESTLVVHVNGVLIAKNTTNGWTFNGASNSIIFHGSAIPAQGSAIAVDYDPATIK
jgi:hypothetical protein